MYNGYNHRGAISAVAAYIRTHILQTEIWLNLNLQRRLTSHFKPRSKAIPNLVTNLRYLNFKSKI